MLRKTVLYCIITAIFIGVFVPFSARADAPNISVSASSAVLIEAESGRVLYSKDENERRPMASTTKIMTALLALENSSQTDLVIIPEEAEGVEGSSAYLRAGDILTMEELTYALLLRSANDAAVAIACHIAGDVDSFADMMNERAAALGLCDTSFKNPHGLDHGEHYTSAHDLALIAAEALKNEDFKKISSTYKKSFYTEDSTRLYVNHNKLLKSYDGSIGMKTGYTKKSGRCLVGAAERNGLTFITVTLDAPNDWQDHKALFDFGFASLEKIELAGAGDYEYSLPVEGGKTDSVNIKNTDTAEIITEKKEHITEEHIRLSENLTAPIYEGDILGEVVFTLDGEVCARVKLIAENNVEIKKKSLLERIKDRLGL
jgi:D-alanyl-D-alanine carboxypeptidase